MKPHGVQEIWSGTIDAETIQLYSAYDRERFVGKRPAVLAVDLYRLAFAGGDREILEISAEHPSSCGSDAWACLAPTKRLLVAARDAQLPIVFSTSRSWRDDEGTATNRRVGRGSREDYAIMDGLREDGEEIVEKNRASTFFGTNLAERLQSLDVDSLIVVGETTSGCVRASAIDAYSNGFHVVLVPECCFDRSPVSHKVALFDLHHKYADVIPIDDVIEGLAQLKRG